MTSVEIILASSVRPRCTVIFLKDTGKTSELSAPFQANLKLTDPVPPFNFFDEDNPIFGRHAYLPASKLVSCQIGNIIVAEVMLDQCKRRCVIGSIENRPRYQARERRNDGKRRIWRWHGHLC